MKTIEQIRALCEGCSGPEMCPAELTAGDVLALLDEIEKLFAELGYIADAKWINFENASEFRDWSQSRARFALTQQKD